MRTRKEIKEQANPRPCDMTEIVTRFLSPRLSRFVRQVWRESEAYTVNPRFEVRQGYLKRDRVRYKLEVRACKRMHAHYDIANAWLDTLSPHIGRVAVSLKPNKYKL